MPYPNYHSARIKDPDSFKWIKVLETTDSGIKIYGGPLKGQTDDKTTAQSYRFPVSKYTVPQVKAWLKKEGIKTILFEKAAVAKKIQSFITIIGGVQAFSRNEIIDMIPADVMAEIKKKDPHPYFRAYVLAHEGEASPNMIGEGPVKISWSEKAIKSIKNIIKRGIQFFRGHNDDNSTYNRDSLGEVVAWKEMMINNKLSHVVVGHFPKETREEVKQYNACSMEALWDLLKGAGKIIADKARKLTGIALGNSNIEKPAFADATVLGSVQAFNINQKKKGSAGMENATFNFNDLKDTVTIQKILPHQLFTVEQLLDDFRIKDIMTKKDHQINTLQKEKETLTQTVEKQKEEKEKFLSDRLKDTSEKRWNDIIEAGNLNDQQKAFMKEQLAGAGDLSDAGLNKHFENSKKVYETSVAPFIQNADKPDVPPDTTGGGDDKNKWLPEENK